MSRIGKAPVIIPDKVNVTIQENLVKVSGPLGSLDCKLRPEISIVKEGNTLILKPNNEERKTGALYGLSRTLVNNMVVGVSQGFSKMLEIQGVGYKAAKEGNTLILSLGYSHPVKIEPPQGIEIVLESPTKITIKGYDKQMVGDVAALIRSKRPPEVYKGKGVRYSGEVVRRKAGKTGKK
jgi:large subunit ribosomal protein L6